MNKYMSDQWTQALLLIAVCVAASDGNLLLAGCIIVVQVLLDRANGGELW